MATVRRSQRGSSVLYDSNGRDYLAATSGCSRQELEEWLRSQDVHSHLLQWYQLCVVNKKRFNDAVEWINTGDNGYFYNPINLEQDLLEACLDQGNVWDSETGLKAYAQTNIVTAKWPTQELWARTAWRIVQNNAGEGTHLRKMLERNPASVYSFVIDILTIAFHSVAFRGEASVWDTIIKGAVTEKQAQSSNLVPVVGNSLEVELDQLSSGQEDLQDDSSEIDTESV